MTYQENVVRAETLVSSGSLATRHFIDGEFVESVSGSTFDSISPRNGQVLTKVSAGDERDVDRAVASARRTFESGTWRRMAPRDRKRVMLAWADLVAKHADELGMLETLEMGKPVSFTSTNDVNGTADALRWYAEAIDKVYGEIAPTGEDALVTITREPLGVIGAVVPWNYPMILASLKFAPAIILGNSIVVKPAEQSSLSMLRIAELAVEAGLPAGVLNVVCGLGAEAGAALGKHMDVDKIVFTGSGQVGRLFQQYAGQSNGKAVQIEAGGKSPQVVLANAGDLDTIADRVAFSLCYNSGQTCTAGTRVLVDRSRQDELLEKVQGAFSAWTPTDPLDPDAKMGTIVSETQLDRVLGFIHRAQEDGLDVVTGGRQVLADTGGYYVEPTIFNNVDNSSELAQEEVFGPVLAVTPFEGFDEGMRLANDTKYGLAAAVWTDNLSEGIRASRELRAGMVWVNTYQRSDITFPFGGFKSSGHGRDRSLHALDEYSALKSTLINVS